MASSDKAEKAAEKEATATRKKNIASVKGAEINYALALSKDDLLRVSVLQKLDLPNGGEHTVARDIDIKSSDMSADLRAKHDAFLSSLAKFLGAKVGKPEE